MKFSGLRILDKSVFDKMTREEFGMWTRNKPEPFYGFKDEFDLIEAEIKNRYELAIGLYTNKFYEKVRGLVVVRFNKSIRSLFITFEKVMSDT